MQFNTYVHTPEDLARCAAAEGVVEVLLAPSLLSVQGTLSAEDVAVLAREAVACGLRPVVVWDILMPERVMAPVCEALGGWSWEHVAALRVTDPGAAWWLAQHMPQMPLQLNVEAGNCNLHALQGWCEVFAPTLERLVLSIELPEEQLKQACAALPVACEVLAAGPILLFYSPRSLLAGPLQQTPADGSFLAATLSAAESNHRNFPTLESQHGTLMFLDRDQWILDRLAGLDAAGLSMFRLDLRHLSAAPDAATSIVEVCAGIHQDPAALRAGWPTKTRAPFFKANRTTAQFSRMKAKTHQLRDEHCLAEILAIDSGHCLIARARQPFHISQAQALALPNGERRELLEQPGFRGLDGRPAEAFERDQIFLMNWHKSSCPGALLRGDTKCG